MESMNRREFFATSAYATAVTLALSRSAQGESASDALIYVNAKSGSDTNRGNKDAPLRSLPAAAKIASTLTGPGATTIILDEGIYAVGETAVFKASRPYSKTARLTICAAVLPDDPEWNPGRMPTLIHTMPLDPNWIGRPDPFGGVAYGMSVETSHVTIQGLKILGMPIVEHPTKGAIHRIYPIGRLDRALDDLLVTQCLFAGDEVTNPNHLGMLVNGSGLVVDHCLFHNVKQTVVYWTPESTGHAMRNCLVYGSYAAAVWTSGIAKDFDYRNNVVSNSLYVWIGQGARSASAEMGRLGPGGPSGPPPAAPPSPPAGDVGHYQVRNCLFAGNKKFTGSGGGPALNFHDNDPSFLDLIDSIRNDKVIDLELDQSKRDYLHAVAGSDAAKIGAGLFMK